MSCTIIIVLKFVDMGEHKRKKIRKIVITDIMCANAANIDAGLALWNGKTTKQCNAQFYFSSINALLRFLNC